MGRDWYSRGGGCKSGRKMKRGCVVEGDHGGEYEEDSSSSSSATTSNVTSGCMTAVSQFFDFHHHFHLRILPTTRTNAAAAHDRRRHQPPPFSIDLPPPPPRHILKGLEAPRNSLEEDAFRPSCSNSTSVIHQTMQKLDNLNVQMGKIQIKTSIRGEDTNTSATPTPRESTSNTKKVLLMYSSADDNTTLCSQSPKTPNLVARLMGLDTAVSPSPPPSHSSSQRLSHSYPRRRSCSDNITSGARSLPETPRVSSERRSDVDRHHRFSLQINKENNVLFEHESMSPRNYAKQILKQVKERVSRRVGMDITNTVNNDSNSKEEIRRDENLLGSGSRSKNRLQTVNLNKDERKQQQVSSKKINSISLPPKPSICEEVGKLRAPEKKDQEEKGKPSSVNKCKKFAGNSMMMMMKKEEPFVRASTSRAVNHNSSNKKSKKTTPFSLSNNDLQSFLPPHVKRDPSPPAPATKLPLKQALSDDARCSKFITAITSQLSSGSSHSDHQRLAIQVIHKRHVDLENGSSNELGLIQYLAALLRRIGINKDTRLVSLSRWFSAPSRHPFDPSIFHHLELVFSAQVTGELSLRCNRRLTFDLAGEVLGEILNSYVKMRSQVRVKISACTTWCDRRHHLVHGGQLIDKMYAKIINFPQANCQTLQDIDALIDRDLKNEPSNIAENAVVAFEEEEGARAAIVSEIERDILESIVHETAAFLVASSGPC